MIDLISIYTWFSDQVISLVVPPYTTDADYLCSGRSLMTGGSKIGSKNYSFNPGYDKFKFPLLCTNGVMNFK